MTAILYAVAATLWFWRGSIFARVRNAGPSVWRTLAACPLCSGTWWGWGIAMACHESPVHVALAGPATGVLALIASRLLP